MKYEERLFQATEYIKKIIPNPPRILLILGSGLHGVIESMVIETTIPYRDIPHFSRSSVKGHLGALLIGTLAKVPLFVMAGRNHYYEGITDEDMRLPIQTFATLGVDTLIVTNACGGINPSFQSGDIMIITDHLNLMGRNPLVGDNIDLLGNRFTDMSEPYDKHSITLLKEIAKHKQLVIQEGVYAFYLGPSYETKAEIRMFQTLGADVVGMSTVPEVIVARHAGMKVLGLACITNMATGISKQILTHEDVLETSKRSAMTIRILLESWFGAIKEV